MLGLSLLEGPGRVRTISKWVDFSDQIAFQYRIYTGSSWAMAALVGMIVVLVRHYANKST
jgi:hypothetical protein